MQERGIFKESISDEEIKIFCQNAQILEVTRIKSPEKELTNPDYSDFINEFYDDESTAPWYVGIRAVESFRDKYNRYPGLTTEQVESDYSFLK